MREFIPPDICDPEVVYGIISGFPIHDSYPIDNRDELDKLFREDYYAWEAMNDLIFDFLTHLRRNGEVDLIEQNSIAINDERARREIKLLDHPRLKNLGTNSRPTFAGVLKMIMSEPRPPPTLIQARRLRNFSVEQCGFKER